MLHTSFLRHGYVWLVAGVMAAFSVYVAVQSSNVSSGTQVSSMVQSVLILPTPLAAPQNLGSSPNTGGGAFILRGNKLIEVSSSSRVINYSQDTSRLTELDATDNTKAEGNSLPVPATAPTSVAPASENESSPSLPSGTSDGGDRCSSCQTKNTQPTSTTGQISGASTTVTSTTIARSDGESSAGGDN